MRAIAFLAVLSLASLNACHTYTGNGALGGAALGAGAGALFAHAIGESSGGGALIGAGLGALAGASFGSAVDHGVFQGRAYADPRGYPPPPPAPMCPQPYVVVSHGYWAPGPCGWVWVP